MRKRLLYAALAAALAFCAFAEGEEAPDPALYGYIFTDGAIIVREDPDGGRWVYADETLRIEVTRTWETPEKIRPDDYNQEFYCFTAEIWCNLERGELPMTLWAEPDKPGSAGTRKTVAQIAMEQGAVYAVSTDLFTQRIHQKTAGIVIRNGDILYDVRNRHHPGSRPPFDTLAIYEDGHIDSFVPKDKGAQEYLDEGATQVYTFGPVLVRGGEIPEETIRAYDRNLNPMHAFGMIEPGHYIDVLCEGRLKSVNGSTGVNVETMARIMKEHGCVIAVNLDGGASAAAAFMGRQLNLVADDPSGRTTCEVMAFGPGMASRTEKGTEKNLDTKQEE